MIVITYLISLNILFPLYFFTEYREYSVLGTLIFDMTILISSKKFAGAYVYKNRVAKVVNRK